MAGSLRFQALPDDETGEAAAEEPVGPEHVISTESGCIQASRHAVSTRRPPAARAESGAAEWQSSDELVRPCGSEIGQDRPAVQEPWAGQRVLNAIPGFPAALISEISL